MHIRPFRTSDAAIVDAVTHDAFAPEDVVTFLNALRAADQLIGEWVAERNDGTVVGHISYCKAQVETDQGSVPCPMLTPLSVTPEYQRQGVGAALVRHAHAQLDDTHDHMIVLGHKTYYPRFGYMHRPDQPIQCKWSQYEAFMIRSTSTPPKGTLQISQIVIDG